MVYKLRLGLIAFAITSCWATPSLAKASEESELLAAFDARCAELDQIDLIANRASADGWAKFDPAPGSVLSELVQAIAGPDPAFHVDTRTYSQQGAPGLVFLISQMTPPEGPGSIECRIIKVDSASPNVAALTAWAGSPGKASVTQDRVRIWQWGPEAPGNHDFVAITYIGSNVRPRFPGKGLTVATVAFLR